MLAGILRRGWREVSCWAIAISELMQFLGTWNYCISQRAIAQPGTQIFRCQHGVSRQPENPEPEPGAEGEVCGKCSSRELAIADEAGHFGDFEIQFVRNSF